MRRQPCLSKLPLRARRLAVAGLAIACAVASDAAIAVAQRTPLLVETWSREVPGTPVRRVVQDADGYLLFATDNGLGRFDGVRFSVHAAATAEFPDSLPDQYIQDLILARNGTKWIATMHAGIAAFTGGRFKSYGVSAGLPDPNATAVFEDSHNMIWVGTQRGVAQLMGRTFETVAGSERLNVYSLAEDATGELWVGTDEGLYRMHGQRLVRSTIPVLNTARIVRMRLARDGSLWIGTAEGLFLLQRDARGEYRLARRFGVRDGLLSTYINAILEERGGTVWVATQGGGVARLGRDGRFSSITTRDGLADNNVTDILLDREGDLWLGTADGLSQLRVPSLRNWALSDQRLHSFIWSVRAETDGTIWVGTSGDGLARVGRAGDVQFYGTAAGLPSEVVFSSYRSRRGVLWVGTKLGIAKADQGRFVDRTRAMGVDPIGVRSFFEDSRGRFYVGTDTALMVGTERGVRQLPRTAGVVSGRIYGITEDAAGRVWVASGTLLRADADSLRVFHPVAGDTLAQVMHVYADTAGVWVADYARGLSLLRGDTLFHFPAQWTTVLSQLLNIVDDGHGSLWLTSQDGLVRVAKSALLGWLRKNPSHVSVRWFSKDDGMRSHDFAKSGSSSGALAPDGRLFFPTTAGIVVAHPDSLHANTVAPQVHIERVVADGTPMPAVGVVRLPRGAERVRIEFTTTMLALSRRARMWYQLDGVDSTWRLVTGAEPRVAEYARLPRGTFTFRVRAQSAEGVPEAQMAELAVESRPPLSRSIWTWIVATTVLVGAITVAHRWRTQRLRRHAALLQRIVDERTAALASREQMQQQLLHAQKLESVGRLAGGVAHDLNNLLTGILGNAELALSEPDIPANLREDLSEVRAVAMRAANLTRQLLAFARKQVIKPRVLRVADSVANVDVFIRRLIPPNIEYETAAEEGDWVVFADPSQVEQVIMNLAINARDAMPNGGRLTVRTAAARVSPEEALATPGLAAGEHVVLEVADTGVGMSSEIQAHLFEPFFTTKEQGKGTGLGLATTFGIVTQAGGAIGVRSVEGSGTTFRVFLPRTEGAVAAGPGGDAPAVPRGTERVLLVEDEATVRMVAERTLRSLGYDVTSAADGVEALSLVEASQPPFALVLSDVRMPRMDGLALEQELHAQWPALRVALMSGHSEALLETGNESRALRKPFTAPELGRFVRAALDAPST